MMFFSHERSSSQAASGVWFRCTTRLENTHGTEFRELLYPWHPWFRLRIGVRPGGQSSGRTGLVLAVA